MSIYQFPTQSSSSPYSSFPMSNSGIQGQLLEVTGMLQILLLFFWVSFNFPSISSFGDLGSDYFGGPVVGCNKLKDTEWISRQDPYVCLEYANTKHRTRTHTGIFPVHILSF